MEMKPGFSNTHLDVYLAKTGPGLWRGYVRGPLLADPLVFEDFSGLLLQVDALLDVWNFPRSFQRKRTFTETAAPASGANVPQAEHAFTLHIISRNNTSWQGMIIWPDGRKAQTFESELELLRLLQPQLG